MQTADTYCIIQVSQKANRTRSSYLTTIKKWFAHYLKCVVIYNFLSIINKIVGIEIDKVTNRAGLYSDNVGFVHYHGDISLHL